MTATTVSQAVEKQQAGPVTLMWSRKAHFDAVLPASVDVEAFLGTAAGALYGNPDLMKAAIANPDSLIVVLMRCAALGHLPGTDEFYLYNRKRKGRQEVAGTEGYRGIIERMYRSGAVAKVVVREVCARDYFDYVEGEMERPVHKIGSDGPRTGAGFFGEKGSRDRGEMVGVYAYAQLTTGAVSRVVLLTADDVMAARDASDSRNSEYSPWNRLDGGQDHPEFKGRSMWWKTGARRLEPWVPTSREYRREQLRASAAAADLGRPPARPAITAPAAPSSEIYDAELVEDTPDASPAGEPQAPAAASPPTPPADPAGEAQDDPDARPPALATSGQRRTIGKHFERLGYSPDSADDWQSILRVTAKLAQIEDLDDPKRLYQDQAARVIGWLDKCDDGAALELLLADGEVSDDA